MDRIYIQKLNLPVLIGTLPQERIFKQGITIDIELAYDMRKAGASDNLFDAVDYSTVERRVIDAVSASSFQLLEALAEKIAQVCLDFPLVKEVRVKLEKPAAAVRAQSIALEIERKKS